MKRGLEMSWLRDKRVLIILLVFVALASWAVYDFLRPTGDKVNWVYDYENARDQSRSEGKPLLIYFHTGWCSWCRKLERETYSNDEVASLLNDNFICLKINAEEHPNLMTSYRIPGYPTVLFVSPEGEEMGRIMGYNPPDIFMVMASPYVLSR